MVDSGKSKKRGARKKPRIDERQAAAIVKEIRERDDQPFGPLRLVRAVIRPRKPKTG